MKKSENIDEQGLVLHKEAISKKKKKDRGRTRPAIEKETRESVEQEKVADHLDVISDRIEMQIDAQIGRHVVDRIKDRRREHEDRHDRDHEMRDIAGKRSERHEKPADSKQEQKERRDDHGQQQTRRRQPPRQRQLEDEKNRQAYRGIDAGADRRRPGQGFAWKNRLFNDTRVFMQKPRRAVGEFAEQIEDNQSGKD